MYTIGFICLLLVSSVYSQDICNISDSAYTILKTPVAAADAAAACTAQNLQFAGVTALDLMNTSNLVRSCITDALAKVYVASWDGVALDTAYDLVLAAENPVPAVTASADPAALQPVLCSAIPALATESTPITQEDLLPSCPEGKTRKVLNFDDLGALNENGTSLYPVVGEYEGLNWENFYGIKADQFPMLHVYRGNAISKPWAVFAAWTRAGDVLPGIISSDKPFDLTSAQLSGAWDNNSTQIITGTTAEGTNVTWNALVSKKTEFQNFPVDFVNLVRVEITTPDGYSNIVIDDLSICQ